MVKVFNPAQGGDTLGASLSRLGQSLFGDQTANLLKTAQLYDMERQNTEMDNLMRRVGGNGGAQALMADPLAQAMILGSGYKPGQFAELGLMGAANQFGAADPRTQNAQVGAGQSYRNTAGAFNADLAETTRNNNLQSADRRYGVDQSIGQQRYEFDNKPIGALDGQGNPVFAPQGSATTGGFQPILSNTERQGTLAGQNFGNLQNLNPNQQEYLGALPGSAGGSRTPKNYVLPGGQTHITTDGITDAQTGQPLPPGGFIGNVQGGAAEVMTNSTMSGVQQNILANNKFANLVEMTREAAQRDPLNFGLPGFVKGTAQDLRQIANGMAAGLGFQDVQTWLDSTMASAAQNGVNPSLLSGVFDPQRDELLTLSDLMVYSAAEALAGQSGRSVSDKDVQFFKGIVGDPRSWMMSQQSYMAKLGQIERIINLNQKGLQDAQTQGAVPQFTNPQPAAPLEGQTQGGTKWRIVQ